MDGFRMAINHGPMGFGSNKPWIHGTHREIGGYRCSGQTGVNCLEDHPT